MPRCYLKKATTNLIIGKTLIREGESVYISNGYRKGSCAKDYVKVTRKDGTFIGEFYKSELDIYNNFK